MGDIYSLLGCKAMTSSIAAILAPIRDEQLFGIAHSQNRVALFQRWSNTHQNS